MPLDVLLSIKPQFAKAIFSGEKLFEFRKKAFKQMPIGKIYVYASRPIGVVIGEFEVDKIISDSPEKLWLATKDGAGINKQYFDKYFDGKSYAIAIKVGNKKLYKEPLSLFEMFGINRPPQSFMYLSNT